jgi:hypothetical protein
MAKVNPKSRAFSQLVKLTPEEFASLKEVGMRPLQRTIPDAQSSAANEAGISDSKKRNPIRKTLGCRY